MRRARSRPDQLKAVEDREIEAIIKKQEAVGLKSITDGEYRRAFWQYDFLGALDGVESYVGERKISFQGVQPKPIHAARQRQARRLHAASDDRAFQVRAVAHQGDAEDDDPVAVVAALPLRPRRRCRRRSIRRWTISTATSARPTARRCAPSPTPAAAICSSTRSISPISAIPSCASRSPRAATIPTSCRTSMPA